MATFVTISQGNASTRGTSQTWKYVNTTVADEKVLMQDAFLPIMVYNDDLVQLDYGLKCAVDDAANRFFEEGKFLTHKNYESLNKALVVLGFPPVTLPDDGQYWQPVVAPAKSPSAAAWKENGKSRASELGVIAAKYQNGSVALPSRVAPIIPTSTAQKLLGKA